MQKLHAGNQNRNLVVIGISHDARGMQAIRQYTEEHGVTFPVVFGDLMVAVNYLGISPQRPQFHVPVFFFVGPDGQILEERNPDHVADRDWYANLEQNLEATVRRLLPPEKSGAKSVKRAPKLAQKPSGTRKQLKP